MMRNAIDSYNADCLEGNCPGFIFEERQYYELRTFIELRSANLPQGVTVGELASNRYFGDLLFMGGIIVTLINLRREKKLARVRTADPRFPQLRREIEIPLCLINSDFIGEEKAP